MWREICLWRERLHLLVEGDLLVEGENAHAENAHAENAHAENAHAELER